MTRSSRLQTAAAELASSRDREERVACERCRELGTRFEIRVPDDLKKAIRIVRAHVAEGTLTELPDGPDGEPFASINADGPWDDIVSHLFACTGCGGRFRLSAETYHGSGGYWASESGAD
jgi:hypothetical protein